MTRLLVIGERPLRVAPPIGLMNEVARIVRSADDLVVRRCRSPAALVEIVREVVARHNPIEILDLYDHGGDGHQRMGEGQLFESDGDPSSAMTGQDIAVQLGPLLTETAHVRLLGCDTSPGVQPGPGRMLLVKLARALGGHRIVFGTMNTTDATDFDMHGLKASHEQMLLFSSSAALDNDAPTPDERRQHILDTRVPPT